MKAQGWHKSPQTFTCGPNDCGITCLCALDARGAADRTMQSGWTRVFGVLSSQKMCRILKCAGRKTELRQSDEKRQNFRETYPQKLTSIQCIGCALHV